MSEGSAKNPFEKGGSDYARFRPTWPQAIADALADLCGSTRHALDVGCGNGQLSCLLAIRFDRVTATDPSAEQIENAFQNPKVDYRQESTEKIGLDDHSVDLIVAAQAAHWFDLDAFYAEAKRVARTGAVIALVSYGVPELDGDVGKRFHDFYWTEIFEYWPAARRHVEDGYATMPFPFEELALPDIAIEREWTLDELLGYVSTWSAAKAARKASAEAVIDTFAKDLASLWGPKETLRTVRWPINGRIGRIE